MQIGWNSVILLNKAKLFLGVMISPNTLRHLMDICLSDLVESN